MLLTSQIEGALRSDPHAGPIFKGVFPCDKLPEISSYPACLVANTDPSYQAGEHWVCMFFDETGRGEYFDSFGYAPLKVPLFKHFTDNGYKYECNKDVLQD